jgi:rhodanese-related sulfurtransferase
LVKLVRYWSPDEAIGDIRIDGQRGSTNTDLKAGGVACIKGEIMFALLMGLKSISPAELHKLVQSPGQVAVMDVNSSQSWAKAHVPGAKNLDPVNYQDSDLPADKAQTLVFYCSNPMCRKAPNAARRAKKIGHSNVLVMSAGISGWLSAQLPTESGAHLSASA